MSNPKKRNMKDYAIPILKILADIVEILRDIEILVFWFVILILTVYIIWKT